MKKNSIILTHPDLALTSTRTLTLTRSRTRNLTLTFTRTFILALTLAFALPLSAQKDPGAVRVLTEFSRKATTAPSVKIDFTVDASDTREGDITTVSGTAVIAGDSYRVTMDESIIISDGKAVWNYLTDVNEVTITDPDPEEGSFIAKPSLLFSLYEEGYKVRLLEENAEEWVIDLYPEDINVSLVRIRLKIGKTLYDLRSAEYRTKDGMTATLTAEKYDLTFRPAAGYFTFNPADHKGVEVIDMR
ncbi:MAG: outer membrane lipoprotein carrier protein LolA [Bacteroidales bacterium]